MRGGRIPRRSRRCSWAGESAVAVIAGEPDELVGMGKWKRAEEEGVDDGEDDDVCADAESEDEDGDGGEASDPCEECGRCSEDLAREFRSWGGSESRDDFPWLAGCHRIEPELGGGLLEGTCRISGCRRWLGRCGRPSRLRGRRRGCRDGRGRRCDG